MLSSPATSTPCDWADPWLNRARILREPESWAQLWLQDASVDLVPLQWLRSALGLAQMTRRVSPGTPGDNQLATYLPFVDHLATADKGFASVIDAVRKDSPVRLAQGHLLSVKGSVLDQLSGLISGL